MFNFIISIVISVLPIRQTDFSTKCSQPHVSSWLLQQFWLNPSLYPPNATLVQMKQTQQMTHTSYWIVEPTYTFAMMPPYSYASTHTKTLTNLTSLLHLEKHYPSKPLETYNSVYFYPMELNQYRLSRTFITYQQVLSMSSRYADYGKITTQRYGSATTQLSRSVMEYAWFYPLFHHTTPLLSTARPRRTLPLNGTAHRYLTAVAARHQSTTTSFTPLGHCGQQRIIKTGLNSRSKRVRNYKSHSKCEACAAGGARNKRVQKHSIRLLRSHGFELSCVKLPG